MKTLIIAFSLLVNVQEFLVTKFGMTWLSSIDEIVMILPYFLIPLFMRKKSDLWIYSILALPIASSIYTILINYTLHDLPRASSAIIQSFINFKYLLYFSLFFLAWRHGKESSATFKIALAACATISIAGYIANLISPSYFVFSDAAWHAERNRISGLQFKPNDLGIFLGILTIFIFYSNINRTTKILSFAGLSALIYFSASRTALIFPATMAFGYLISKEGRMHLLGAAIVFLIGVYIYGEAILGSFILSETSKNLGEFSSIESSQYIRAIMLYLGARLLIDYFPIGSGAGNFGSVMSDGSPVYIDLGVSSSYFFVNHIGIYDSNFASIMGEYGIAGVFLFYAFVLKSLRNTLKNKQDPIKPIFFLILVTSLTQPLLSYQVNSVNFLVLIFALAGTAPSPKTLSPLEAKK